MPPQKKRKAAAIVSDTAATSPSKRGRPSKAAKAAQAAETEPVSDIAPTAPSSKRGRPLVPSKAAKAAQAAQAEPVSDIAPTPPRKRGRPSKAEKAAQAAEAEPLSDVAPTPPPKRGRPSKAAKAAHVAEAEPVSDVAPTPPPKRGRPSKAAKVAQAGEAEPVSDITPTQQSKPGRRSNAAKAAKTAKADTSLHRSTKGTDATANDSDLTATPRGTRSAARASANDSVVAAEETKTKAKSKAKGKAKSKAASSVEATTMKKGTRGVAKKKPAKAKGKSAAASSDEEDEEDSERTISVSPAEQLRGRATQRGVRTANFSIDVSFPKTTAEEAEDADEEDADGPNFWLMKAEPQSRIEKGMDVKFSIDDLKNAAEPEAWDGVRNATACNNMRLMRKGDQAFFYHSNCKVPGIAGTMEIVEEHTPDDSALDPEHPYYDPKSNAEKPRWEKVRVLFRRKFPELIKLKELQKYAKEGGVLRNLQTLKQTRLSVSKVSKKEWDFIMALVGDEETDVLSEEGGIMALVGDVEKDMLSEGDGTVAQVGDEETNVRSEEEEEEDDDDEDDEDGDDEKTVPNDSGAGQLNPGAFGPGEGGVADGESNLATAWVAANHPQL